MTVATPHRHEEDPAMTFSHLPPWLSCVFSNLSSWLDRRTAARLPLLLIGILFASGRRTVTSWFRPVGITHDFRRAYHVVSAVGRRSADVALATLFAVRPCLAHPRRLVVAIDDTPTPRYGPCVEGAGLHHNPTPGPAGEKFVYGHNWVLLAGLAKHPDWGTIALPLQASLYVRHKDVLTLPPHYPWEFHTKLELAVAQLRWLKPWVEGRAEQLWVVVDGGYAKKAFLRPARQEGFTVVSRLRKDAALRTLPATTRRPHQRGPLPTYGKERISLAKRAGQTRGWEQVACTQYGARVTKTIKTFLATYRPAGGLIRVVLVKEEHGWIPFFSTSPEASVVDILEAAADRGAIEPTNKDVKEVWGAGQQQVRNLYANVGAFNLNCWMYSLVEGWAWQQPEADLVDRSDSPWDEEPRRPSHADKRKALQRQVLHAEIQAALAGRPTKQRFRELAEKLLQLAA
jgi:DDE superfamily endonuclease